MSAGMKIAQACHAAFEFAREHPDITHQWMDMSNYICILEAKDELELIDFIDKAYREGIRYSIFKEPDDDNHITCIVLEAGNKSKRLCSRLPLALKENKKNTKGD
jgi:peptidyl-tRNA hydrolase